MTSRVYGTNLRVALWGKRNRGRNERVGSWNKRKGEGNERVVCWRNKIEGFCGTDERAVKTNGRDCGRNERVAYDK